MAKNFFKELFCGLELFCTFATKFNYSTTMKKILLTSILSILSMVGFAQVQDVMIIEKQDGKKICINIDDIHHIEFGSTEPELEPDVVKLSGEWQGNWGMYYQVEDPYGNTVEFDSYDTDIVFYADDEYANKGYGYQVDWYSSGPYERMSFRFDWYIDKGIIYLNYPGFPEYSTRIRDYQMKGDSFTGYFSNGTQPFTLKRMNKYYNWSEYTPYEYNYWVNESWSWDYSYYYDKIRSAVGSTKGKVPKTDTTTTRIVMIGSRLTE